MKLRFLAASGPVGALGALERRIATRGDGGLIRIFEGGALKVWTVSETPSLSAADGLAVLVGLLFDRATGTRLSGLHIPETVLGDRWGPYVLFTVDAAGYSVLRDPSGAIPVYYGAAGDLQLYASDAALLELAWPAAFRPDPDFIRHWLTFPFLRAARTGVQGVRELLPGACRRVGNSSGEIVEAWSPFSFMGAEQEVAGFDDAAALLREEILRTVQALAATAGDVVMQLSGGLDSSIVAAALCRAGISFRALTFATLGSDGDERLYAREMARRCGALLVELIEEGGQPVLAPVDASWLRPPANPLLQPLHRAITLRLALLGADAVLDGAGGDNVFAALNTGSPAIDAFRRESSMAAIGALGDIAQVHGCTFWAAARSALRRVRRGAPSPWPRDTRFLAEGTAPTSPEPHPWLAHRAGLLPGKADHLRLIAGIHHFLADPTPMSPATLHPLLAQPLIEACLRIPSWLWISRGRDRAVAREAFRGLVPDTILERRRKGSLESMLLKNYVSGRPLLERFLLEGRLADLGIIDAAAVGAYLRQTREPRDTGYIRIVEIAAAEQWLRSFGD